MATGGIALQLDSAAITTLAQLGARQTREKWPAPFSNIPPDSIQVHVLDGGRLEVLAKGIPSLVLRPAVESAAAIGLKIHIGPVGVPGFLGGLVTRQLNELLARWRAMLAGQGLHVDLASIHTEAGLLTVAAEIASAG